MSRPLAIWLVCSYPVQQSQIERIDALKWSDASMLQMIISRTAARLIYFKDEPVAAYAYIQLLDEVSCIDTAGGSYRFESGFNIFYHFTLSNSQLCARRGRGQ